MTSQTAPLTKSSINGTRQEAAISAGENAGCAEGDAEALFILVAARKNSKLQTPNSREGSNSNLQSKRLARLLAESASVTRLWNLVFEVSLKFGVWSLMFPPVLC